jgi:hypothetical protein
MMQPEDSRHVALSLIQRYGMQAQAVANRRAAEMQSAGDAAGFDKWRQVHDLIWELRRTERAQAATAH